MKITSYSQCSAAPRELYGAMLALSGKHQEALDAYESALRTSPNCVRNHKGAPLAATALCDASKADRYQEASKGMHTRKRINTN